MDKKTWSYKLRQAFFAVMLVVTSITVLVPAQPVAAAGMLTVSLYKPDGVTPLNAYNLVVDSNVKSPSTYAPRVATVIARFCNTGDAPLTNVYGYIGNGTTPGTYPARNSLTDAEFQTGQKWNYLYNTGSYAYRHVGPASDASRYIGTLEAGQCVYQYWTIEYPACENVGGLWQEPPCTGDPTWGTSVKPDDDLSLAFKVWGRSDQNGTIPPATWTMTMRNEISAMANKIEPNGNPAGRWFNTDSPVRVGDIITTNGVLYSLGNVRFGFDNDGDFAPDYNAWLQPISQADYNPTCFRLIRSSGVLTVTRGGGNPTTIIRFTDQLYFTNLPPDNTNVRGEVYYTFLALNGPCNINLSPYQEVASGFDNEKFNGDYGKGIPPIVILEPEITIDKSSDPDTVATGSTTTYRIPFSNLGDANAGLTLSSGGYVDMPLTITDEIPNGMQLAQAATVQLNGGGSATIMYSTDSGATWSTTAPVNVTSTWPNNKIVIRWSLNQPLPKNSSGHYAEFVARVPSGYTGPAFIENTACIGLGDALPFGCATDVLMVQGSHSIGDFVWRDLNTNGVQDGGPETGIEGVTVWLYWDKNNDGKLDAGDRLIGTRVTNASGLYSFANLPTGNYLVVVDSDSTAIPTGYTNTTATVHAVKNLSGAYLLADFGFGPALTLTKALSSASPAYEGELVTYNLTVRNNLPGGPSDSEGFCTYTYYANQGITSGNSGWQFTPVPTTPSESNIVGEPNDTVVSAVFSGGNRNWVHGLYSIQNLGGVVTKVEGLYTLSSSGALNAGEYVRLFVKTGTVANSDPSANSIATIDLTSLPTNLTLYTWVIDNATIRDWTTLTNSALKLGVVLEKSGGAGSGRTISVDAVGFRITTNQSCGGRDSTITLLPLSDSYDASKLEFVSASISPTSVTLGGDDPYAGGNTGTISWDNVGPLAAGQTRTIQVTFKALEPPSNLQTTTINYANVRNAKFGNGRAVNNADAQAPATTINPTAKIGDTIWVNNGRGGGVAGNALKDGTEQGIPNLRVWLYTDPDGNPNTDDGTLVATTMTDANGYYLFEAIRNSGNYRVVVDTSTLPAGFTSNWDPDGGTAHRSLVNIPAGLTDRLDIDFGYTIANVIYGNVWNDYSGDSNRQTGENGIQGVTVYLCTSTPCSSGNAYRTTTTDASGNYRFDNLPDNTYYVGIANSTSPLGADWTNTRDPEGAFPTEPANPPHQSAAIIAEGGNLYGSYDFGYYRTGPYNLSGKVYADWNASNTWNTGEPGFRGITVTLTSPTGAVIAVTTTDADGNYSFGNLPPGDYTVIVDQSRLPSQYTQTEDPDVTRDGRTTVTITNADRSGLNFGYKPDGFGSIGDTVWRDDNRDGLQGTTEPGLNGITVWLYVDYGDGNGYQRVMEMSTANGGQYLFANLPPGNYRVVVDDADPQLPTDGYGNPFVPSTPTHFDVALTAGQTYLQADFGFATGGVIGDRVWQDNNGNGNQDEGEPGINGVTVGLFTWIDVDGDGVYNVITDTISATPLATQVTSGDGNYLFTGLPAGNYVVKVISGVPAGFRQSGDPDWLTPCTDTALCDGASGVELRAGQIDMSRDFGYIPPGVIGDFIWFDADGDGVQDPGEGGIGFVTVTLYKWNSGTSSWDLHAATKTDSDGYYTFGDIGEGTYEVRVDTSTLPAGVVATYDRDNGTNSPNSIVTGIVVNSSGVVTGINGEACTHCNLEFDFGYRYFGDYSISGHVFFDAGSTGDGTNDTYVNGTDTPYANVTLYLWRDGQIIGQTQTDSNGYYIFNNLPAGGNYTVSVDRGDYLSQMNLTATPNSTPQVRSFNTITNLSSHVTNQDFGFHALIDFGDLPDTYGTTVANNGAGHILGGPHLGATVQPTANGNPTPLADGDNAIDDDGITFTAGQTWTPGATVTLNASVSGANGYLVGWFDWNGDGKFDESEMVIFGNMSAGNNALSLTIPSNATNSGNQVFMRFRLYDKTTLTSISPTGLARGGEVEDYRHTWTPTAVDLLRFEAAPQGNAVLITWETATELDNLGFNLYRSENAAGPWTRVNADLIPAQYPGAVFGAVYEVLDAEVTAGVTVYYRLEDVDIYGVSTFHGPLSVTPTGPTAATVVGFGAQGAPGLGLGLLLVAAFGLILKRRR